MILNQQGHPLDWGPPNSPGRSGRMHGSLLFDDCLGPVMSQSVRLLFRRRTTRPSGRSDGVSSGSCGSNDSRLVGYPARNRFEGSARRELLPQCPLEAVPSDKPTNRFWSSINDHVPIRGDPAHLERCRRRYAAKLC